jgi:hypothetical protein
MKLMRNLIILILIAGSLNVTGQKTSVIIKSDTIILPFNTKLRAEAEATKKKITGFTFINAEKSEPFSSPDGNLNLEKSESTNNLEMTFNFTFMENDGKKNIVLVINNPFNKMMYYKAKIKVPKRTGYEETSIMPIYPGIFTIEMWPYEIESIILYDFELKKK